MEDAAVMSEEQKDQQLSFTIQPINHQYPSLVGGIFRVRF